MLTDNFEVGFDDELNIICNVVFVLPIEFNKVNEVIEEVEDENITK